MASSSRTLLRPGFGSTPTDGRTRRYDAPALPVTRYHAPASIGSHRIELPAAQMTRFRAATRIGTITDAGRSEIRA